jgi:hypothetical protein
MTKKVVMKKKLVCKQIAIAAFWGLQSLDHLNYMYFTLSDEHMVI